MNFVDTAAYNGKQSETKQNLKLSYTSLLVSEVDLCNFIGYLFSENYAPSSDSSHASAIGYLHKLCSLQDPTEKFLPKKLLKGCHNRTLGFQLQYTFYLKLFRLSTLLSHSWEVDYYLKLSMFWLFRLS